MKDGSTFERRQVARKEKVRLSSKGRRRAEHLRTGSSTRRCFGSWMNFGAPSRNVIVPIRTAEWHKIQKKKKAQAERREQARTKKAS